MEILHIDLAPRSELNNDGHMKGVEEYLFVLEGCVQVTVHGEEVALQPYDSIRFAADTSHRIENTAESPAKFLNIIHYT